MKIIEIKNREIWHTHFKNVNKRNISQEWNYGEFKSDSKNKVKRFKVIDNEDVISIFQVIYKKIKFLPFLTFIVLNRGPLYLIEDEKLKLEVLKKIGNNFTINKGYILIISPFLKISKSLKNFLLKNRFLSFFSIDYETSYIDLKKDIDNLRSNLHYKWRNQLSKSEKNDIIVKIDRNPSNIEFYINEYQKMLEWKNFTGLSKKRLIDFLELFIKNRQIIFLTAFDMENNIIGFVILSTFSKTAVYYIGWSSSEGRKMYSTNFLLWKSIVYLKSIGFEELDLGGYDSKNVPGIANFKKRMGGEESIFIEKLIKII